MKLIVNPEYEYLHDDILRVIDGDYVATEVYCHKRNVVERFSMQGKEYVIKVFKQPNIFNRFVYTYLRKTKAERAYRNAQHLLELGIDTPRPVAYATRRKGLLFSTGYLISEYMPYDLVRNVYTNIEDDADKGNFSKDFLDFTLSMHNKGVLPLDFNSSNIFFYYDKEAGAYRFALTDINRMRFGKVPSTARVMRSFEQLGVSVEAMYKLAVYYCSRRKNDVEFSLFVFLFYRIRSRIKRTFKRKAKEKMRML